MNRKRQSKLKKAEIAHKAATALHPYDDVTEWFGADFSRPPETEEWVKAFQERIDAAFGVKGAFVLAWSGDRTYWDEFYTDWHSNGAAKDGSLEKKPILLWHTFWVNDLDYIYLYPPRWVILESIHPAQYRPTWETGVWVSDPKMLGGRKQIRTIVPPDAMYQSWRTVAEHDEPLQTGAKPLCCAAANANGLICYGRYRKPNETDLDALRKMRSYMDENGYQRPDEAHDARTKERLRQMTRYYIDQSRRMQRTALRNFAMIDPKLLLNSSLADRGISLSAREIEALAAEAIDRIESEKDEELNNLHKRSLQI